MTRKRKFRTKHQLGPGEKNDTSDDDESPMAGKRCPHLSKAINLSGVKKALKTSSFGDCQQCQQSSDKRSQDASISGSSCSSTSGGSSNTATNNTNESNDASTWMCLQCGHQGCGRTSTAQHALHHYQTPHSDVHSVVVNTTTWSIWCYDCDEEIPQGASQRLVECIELIRKQAGSRRSRISPSPSGSCFGKQPDLENCIVEELPRKEDTSKPKSRPIMPELPRVKGLVNMGNTCFFNAVMQNLNQTPFLQAMLEERMGKDCYWKIKHRAGTEADSSFPVSNTSINDDEERIFDIHLTENGPVTGALHGFLKDMAAKSSGKNNVVNPGQLFLQICKKSPQFRGFQQQDSHELLRHLLDAVKTEEVKRQQMAILRCFGLNEKVNPKNVDNCTKAKVKAYKPQTTHTLIDSIFGGQLISTVMCDECHKPSQIFEPFMDLSLPVAEEKTIRPSHQKRMMAEEQLGSCFGKPPMNDSEVVTSKYQEKKLKKQAKRDAKRRAKSEKLVASHALLRTKATEKSSSNSLNSEQKDDDYESGAADENNPNLTDADVEDNDESETISSHHSRTSSKMANDVETSVGMATDAVSTSSRDTMNQDLNDLGDVSVDTSGYCDSSSIMSLSMIADSSSATDPKVEGIDAESLDYPAPNTIRKSYDNYGLTEPQIEELCSRAAELGLDGSEKNQSPAPSAYGFKESARHMNSEKYTSVDPASDTDEFDRHNMQNGILRGVLTNGTCVVDDAKTLAREWLAKSRTTLAPRYQPTSRECSVMSCLNHFTAPELLTGNNKFGCENCTRLKAENAGPSRESKKNELVYCNASKQLLIFSPPAILTLHLKRFQQVGFSLRKVNQYVEFPLILDLAPFCSSICLGLPHVPAGCHKVLYSLYGVVEHSGRLTGGHYTAYVKVRPPLETGSKFLNSQPLEDDDVNSWLEKMAKKCEASSTAAAVNNFVGDDDDDDDISTSPGKWYHVSDSHVTEVSEATVLRCQAYLLFYERIL